MNKKYTYGFCFSLGSGVISWFSRKQKLVVLSYVEVKCMVASLVSCEFVWLHKTFTGLLG